MLGNQIMQIKNVLQKGHDLLRETQLHRCRYLINGKVFKPLYAEPTQIDHPKLVAYKLLVSRIDPIYAWRDHQIGPSELLDVHERIVVVDQDWRKIQGYGVGFVVHEADGWYFGRKKIFGYGDTIDKALWLYNLRVKRATLKQLTAAA